MRALLERLEEATYARDRAVRDRAQQFADDLLKFLRADTDTLERKMAARPDYGFEVEATAFTRVLARPTTLILLPRQRGVQAQVETYDDGDALVLFCLYQGGDLSDVAQYVDRSAVIHEVVHLLDPGRTAPTQRDQGALRRQDREAYFNSPAEWNAYWQQGAAELERALHTRHLSRGDIERTLDRYWDPRFLSAMDAPTRRRFDKRLAALWDALRSQGLL